MPAFQSPNAVRLTLPPEVWERISDFADPSPLSAVSRQLHGILSGRHWAFDLRERHTMPRDPLEHVFGSCIKLIGTHTRTARLKYAGLLEYKVEKELGALLQACALEAFHLSSMAGRLTQIRPLPSMASIMAITQLPSLETLNLQFAEPGKVFSHTLPRTFGLDLSLATQLKSLRLGLSDIPKPTDVSDTIRSLGSLRGLTNLDLDLSYTHVKLECLPSLSDSWPKLTRLSLNLSSAELRNGNTAPLAALGHLSLLEHLQLKLKMNNLSEVDVAAVTEVSAAPRLRHLELDFGANYFGSRGVAALSKLEECSLLQTLTLGLSECGIKIGGALPLRALASFPSLREVSVDLSHNDLGADDAPFVVALLGARDLTRMQINIQHNSRALKTAVGQTSSAACQARKVLL